MMVPGSINPLLMGGNADPLDELGVIGHSVRFNSADGAYLSRTPAAAGNRKIWTWSAWVKRAKLGVVQKIFAAMQGSATNEFSCQFTASDNIEFYDYSGAYDWRKVTNAVYRDLSAHYHIMVVRNGASALLYVNGSQVTSFSTSSDPGASFDGYINNNTIHTMMAFPSPSVYQDGYISDVYFVDGQALTPSSFGAIHPATNQWRPKQYTGTYGTNGFRLDFSDGSAATAAALGADRSGNGNNWTPVNISVTAGVGCDWQTDTPTNNFCTLNALDPAVSPFTLTNGALELNANGAVVALTRRGTFPMVSGQWYWECVQTVSANDQNRFGIIKDGASLASASEVGADSYGWAYQGSSGNKVNAGSSVAYGATWTTNDVIGVLFDADAGTLTFYKNGTSQGVAYSGLTSGPYYPAVSSNSTTSVIVTNFGQRTLLYPVAGADSPGTKNLPIKQKIMLPGQYVNALLYTGNNAARSLTGLGFSPDLVIGKSRAAVRAWGFWDTVRGATKYLDSSSLAAEVTDASNGLTSFDADGFSLASGVTWNNSAEAFAAYGFKKGATPGFDIVSYAGNGTARTIAHSLGTVPKFMIVKDRGVSAIQHWRVYHADFTSASYYLGLDETNGQLSNSVVWDAAAPTSSVFSVGTSTDTNGNGDNFIAYLFAEVAGFSKFSSYVGNGSSTDGAYVHCGFMPAFVLIKNISASSNWVIIDNKTSPANVSSSYLNPNLNIAETPTQILDFVADGMKIRHASTNASGETYVFAAFAEFPFRYANAR